MSDEQQVDDTYSEEDAAIEAVKGPALALMISASIGLLWQAVLIFAHLNMMIVEGADPAPKKRKRKESSVRFRFVEGFSNAVRRPVFMNDLL